MGMDAATRVLPPVSVVLTMSTVLSALLMGLTTVDGFVLHNNGWQHTTARTRSPSVGGAGVDFDAPVGVTGSIRPLRSFSTAYERLANNWQESDPAFEKVEWMDVLTCVGSSIDATVMPLYPLDAVYLPNNSTHVINNVEPRNIQMALDLLKTNKKQFCVTLRAKDTGRIARIGTLMEVDHADSQKDHEGNICRVVVTCRAVTLVRINSVLNPTAFSAENRLKRSSEYLKAAATVLTNGTRMNSAGTDNDDNKNWEGASSGSTLEELMKDFSMVRTMYDMGVGSDSLMPAWRDVFRDALPDLSYDDLATPAAFWTTVELWQMLCNTLREHNYQQYSEDRNAFLEEARRRVGGMMEYPIRPSHLKVEDRIKAQQMDEKALDEFAKIRMEPVLDFQALLALPTQEERLDFFAGMVKRERERLVRLGIHG